jgi:hypothetical protein
MENCSRNELLAALGQLKCLIEEQLAEIHDRVEHATEVVRENTEEVGALRDAIDELRELYQWALNNHRLDATSPFRLTSMPLDAAAPDYAERLNRYSAADLPSERPHPDASRQSTLWSE